MHDEILADNSLAAEKLAEKQAQKKAQKRSVWRNRFLTATKQHELYQPAPILPAKRVARKDAPEHSYNILLRVCEEDEIRVRVPLEALRLFPKHPTTALVVSQLAYWLSPCTLRKRDRDARSAMFINDKFWALLDHKELGRRTGLSKHQVYRSLQQLTELKMLEKAHVRGDYKDFYVGRLVGAAEQLVDPKAFGITLFGRVLRICENKLIPALVLSNFCYWHGRSNKDERCRASYYSEDGRPWISRSRRQLAKELHVTEDQAREALEFLVSKGMLATQVGPVIRKNTWPAALYSIEPENIAGRLNGQPVTTWYM